MASNKNVANRWWDLYMNDDECREYFNGLHLLCALYGNDEDDSDTLMQSMTANRDYQIETLEFATVGQTERSVKVLYVEQQHPEGFFARLHPNWAPDFGRRSSRALKLINPTTNLEDWGWMIYYYDAKLRCRNNNDSNGKEQSASERRQAELQRDCNTITANSEMARKW